MVSLCPSCQGRGVQDYADGTTDDCRTCKNRRWQGQAVANETPEEAEAAANALAEQVRRNFDLSDFDALTQRNGSSAAQ